MADDIAGVPVAGAPLPEQTTDYEPMLAGKGENVIVALHNPLSQDFRVQYARSIVQGAAPNAHLSSQEKQTAEKGGVVPVKDANPQAHTAQYLILKAGETINLPGDIAQVAVRQLTNWIIQTSHKGRSSMPLADSFARHEVESQVIISISDNMTFFNQGTPVERTDKEIAELNATSAPASAPMVSNVPNSDPKVMTDPPPGQGASYDTNDKTAK